MNGRYGELVVDGEQATIVFVRRLSHPIEAVWSAIADPEQRAAWFGETVLNGRVGGTIEMVPLETPVPPEMKRMTGRILVWDPPHVLEHEWNQAIVEESVVRYELTADGEETVLRFSHRALGLRNAKGFLPGTHAFLDRLEAYLSASTLPGWMVRYREVASSYPSWS